MPEHAVEVADETGALPSELLAEVEAVALWTLGEESAADAELSIALVSDETIARLNGEYLSHEGPTDVISFPLDDVPGRVVGDVYIGMAQAARQAGEEGIAPREELLRLAVHGVLHVLGWEHPDEAADRPHSPMYRRQEELLRGFLARGG